MQITLDGKKFEIEDFDVEVSLDGPFLTYARRVLVPFIRDNCPRIAFIHCLRSGFPYGALNSRELDDMVTHAVVSAKYDRQFDVWSGPIDPAKIAEAVEDILDSLTVRVLFQSRPAPSLAFANGVPAIAALPAPRQLAILLSYLLYNAKGLDSLKFDSGIYIAAVRATIQLADYIQENWRAAALDDPKATQLVRMHEAMIELDAKYTLTKLRLSSKEAGTLESLRAGSADGVDMDAIESFVMSLLLERDAHLDVDLVSPRRWTNVVFYRSVISASDRLPQSNIAEQKPVKKPLTDKQKVRAANKSMFASILREGF